MSIMLVAACASSTGGLSEEALLTQAPVVNTAPGAIDPGDVSALGEAEAGQRLETAQGAFLREDYAECLKVVRETLEMGAPASIAAELRALRYEARRRYLSRQVLAAKILAVQDVATLGEVAELTVVLRNVSGEPVTVFKSADGASDTVIVIDARSVDYDIYGNVRSRTSRRRIPIPEDLSIGIGGRVDVPFALDTGDVKTRHFGFTVLRLTGTLRPAAIHSGEERFYSGVEIEAATLRILPPGYEPIAADPLGTIDKACRLGAQEHLLLAAELSAPERRDEVVGVLVERLGDASPGMAMTIMAALRRLTGIRLTGDPEAWVSWWEEQGGKAAD
jgi:hypothetical protein